VFIKQVKSSKSPEYLKSEIEKIIWLGAGVLVLIGILISFAWWTGYYISKRLLHKLKEQ
jgi:hypothetical protein